MAAARPAEPHPELGGKGAIKPAIKPYTDGPIRSFTPVRVVGVLRLGETTLNKRLSAAERGEPANLSSRAFIS